MNQKFKPHGTGRPGADRRAMDRRKACFKTAVRAWAMRLKVQPAQIRVQQMRNKWASCSPGQWISFNTNLLGADTEFQDYVMVHELLHLRIPNHGKLFKALMTIHLPGWEQWDVDSADLRTAASFSAARSRARRDKPEVYPALSGVSPYPRQRLMKR